MFWLFIFDFNFLSFGEILWIILLINEILATKEPLFEWVQVHEPESLALDETLVCFINHLALIVSLELLFTDGFPIWAYLVEGNLASGLQWGILFECSKMLFYQILVFVQRNDWTLNVLIIWVASALVTREVVIDLDHRLSVEIDHFDIHWFFIIQQEYRQMLVDILDILEILMACSHFEPLPLCGLNLLEALSLLLGICDYQSIPNFLMISWFVFSRVLLSILISFHFLTPPVFVIRALPMSLDFPWRLLLWRSFIRDVWI
jgi:hypothetical protein